MSYLQVVIRSKEVDVGRRDIVVEIWSEFGDETFVGLQGLENLG